MESRWYEAWEKAGLFRPQHNGKPRFTITIPPPNITGSLHMGHALCYPIQDLLGRYQRLRGKDVLILPGTDHASIATQSVVEKMLRKEGSSGAQIGREKFLERAWLWRDEIGDAILQQFRRFGCAFDWERTVFTMDESYIRAVNTAFIDWFEVGLIYRGKRVINWDPVLKTNISDIETERRTVKGKLYYIRYPFADGSGHVTIATTRPETMLADVAVAVHPSDPRYHGLVGKDLILPLMNRPIPLIADIYPDPEFGSGAVKITPAHDANDFTVGQRHKLPMPVVIDEAGKINENGGVYAGLDRNEARKRVVADLEEQGFLDHIDDHEIPIIVSERSGEPIEPLLSEQWFADQPKLAKAVIDAVEAGKIKFVPERYTKIFVEWLENVYDWNISRQLWWGQRVPVYYTEDGTPFAAHSWEEAQQKAGDSKIVRQDDDVLDTWFSSGLWLFGTLGWPEETEDLKTFYPTSVLVTSREIIYLWVARMAMMGLDFMKDIPFEDVYIYATVLTEDGRRMSKSLGTGVDPNEVMDRIGADALRYTLLSQTGYNQDIRYSVRRTDEARNFCNKIWNATRFVLMNLDGEVPSEPGELQVTDEWLLSRLYETERIVREAYDAYDNATAAQQLYRFFWSELCDWYIEVSKSRLSDPAQRQTPQWVLLKAIEAFVTMMHPIMPHITEEIYSHLPISGKAPFLMSADWPKLDLSFHRPESESKVERWFEITRSLRALRAALEIEPRKTLPAVYVEGDLAGGESVIASQAWCERVESGKPAGKFVSTTIQGVDLHLELGDMVDLAKLRDKLSREQEKLADDGQKLRARLENPMFVERAKPEVVERERETLADVESRLEKVVERLALLG
ncbi:MAG: valine--tRNA ligase [Methanoregulaceae archaeon]|nr:valine--tRNA ligase [Methanoregulaceae archaeon]